MLPPFPPRPCHGVAMGPTGLAYSVRPAAGAGQGRRALGAEDLLPGRRDRAEITIGSRGKTFVFAAGTGGLSVLAGAGHAVHPGTVQLRLGEKIPSDLGPEIGYHVQ